MNEATKTDEVEEESQFFAMASKVLKRLESTELGEDAAGGESTKEAGMQQSKNDIAGPKTFRSPKGPLRMLVGERSIATFEILGIY